MVLSIERKREEGARAPRERKSESELAGEGESACVEEAGTA